MRRILAVVVLASLVVGCDERELLNHSAKVPIDKSTRPADAHTLIVQHSGFVVRGVAVATSAEALRALGSPLPHHVLVLACARIEHERVRDVLRELKDQGVTAGFASADSAQCGDAES